MMSRFSNGPAFRNYNYLSQKVGKLIYLVSRIERMDDDPQPLASPGYRRIEDRPDIQPRLLQPLRQRPDFGIAGDDHHLDGRRAVQPLITDLRLAELVDKPLQAVPLCLHRREQPVGIGDGTDACRRQSGCIDKGPAEIDQKLAQPPAPQHDRPMTAYRFSKRMHARETFAM